MLKLLPALIIMTVLILISCSKDKDSGQQGQQFPQRFSTTTICTTYNSNGTVLSYGSPFTYTTTMEISTTPSFDYRIRNFAGDSDTTVKAIKNAVPGAFIVPQQAFRTSTGFDLEIIGQGIHTGDSLNYSWSFFFGNPLYKSHDCSCKSRRL